MLPPLMRLGQFITENTEAILAAWESFAATILPSANMSRADLRDDAAEILRATVRDMATAETGAQRAAKSQGHGLGGAASRQLDGASASHAAARLLSGFELPQLVSEYRALRATVLRLWHETRPIRDQQDADDVTRFRLPCDVRASASHPPDSEPSPPPRPRDPSST